MFDRMRPCLAVFALLALGAGPERFTLDELEALEQEKRAAEEKLVALETAGNSTGRDLAALEAQLISAAMESRRREEDAAAAELKLIDLMTRLNSSRASLLADQAALEDLLGLLASSGRRRPPALIVSPNRANEAVRRAIATGDVAPRLAARSEALAGEIETLNRLEGELRRERARLEAAEAVLALKQAEIRQLAAAKRAAFEDIGGDADQLRARVAELGEKAEGLRDLLADLEASAPFAPGRKPSIRPRLASLSPATPGATASDATPAPKPVDKLAPLGKSALGRLARPVAGLVSRGYGDRMPGGGKAEGLSIRTRAGAQVLAPVDGRIEYAGKFRSYGEMLILRTSDGYHVILSGMRRIYGTPGQSLRAGEPVGEMAARDARSPELYIELRREGEPMNPALWMKRGR